MQRFKNILLVLNESHIAGPSVQRAVELARLNKANLMIVDVLQSKSLGRNLQTFSDKLEDLHKEMIAERKQEMEELLHGYLININASIEVLYGKPFVEIIRYAQTNKCDLVIKSVGQEKRFSSMLFGSTDLKLLRKCPCPVWIVKPDDHPNSRKILAAIDLESFASEVELDQLNKQIIEISSTLTLRESSELHIVNAFVIFGGSKLAKKLSKTFEDDASNWVEEQKKNINLAQNSFKQSFAEYLKQQNMTELDYKFHFIEGEAEEVIVDLVTREEIDLVVMGTVGRSDLAGFLIGNTSEAVLNQINCSILAIKPPGFLSPVTV